MIKAKVKVNTRPARTMEQQMRRIGIRKAIMKCSAIVKEAVVTAAPSKFGWLKKSIRIKLANYGNGERWRVFIGPKIDFTRKRKKQTVRPGRYATVIEKGGQGHRAIPFLAPALAATKDQFHQSLIAALAREIERHLHT